MRPGRSELLDFNRVAILETYLSLVQEPRELHDANSGYWHGKYGM